jgi:hypothetical protein
MLLEDHLPILTMSHDDVYVMCHSKLHDVFVTWHDAVVSDIIFQVFRHVGRRHVRLGSSCTVIPIIEHCTYNVNISKVWRK